MTTRSKAAIPIILLLLLPGCWGSNEAQKLLYATAIGMDYKDGQYYSYVQVLNFTNIAKTDVGFKGEQVPVWIAKGKGRTVSEALGSINTTSQLKISWGHVKAFVVSGRALKTPGLIERIYESVNRYREVRYNILVYGTDESIEKLFSLKSIMNMAPIDNILMDYEQLYEQATFLYPSHGYRVIRELNEPARTLLLPSLSIDNKVWHEDLSRKELLKVNGAYIFHSSKEVVEKWLSFNDLKGVRWVQPRLRRALTVAPNDAHPFLSYELLSMKSKVEPTIRNGKAYFHLSIKVGGNVIGITRNVSLEQMKEELATVIRDEVYKTYKKGAASQLDVLNLYASLYKKHPKAWVEMQDRLILGEDTLESVKVTVNLSHTGKYKGRYTSQTHKER